MLATVISRLWIIVFLVSLASPIPYTVSERDRPSGFEVKDRITIYEIQVGAGFDSDMFCQLLFLAWWKQYQAERIRKMIYPVKKSWFEPGLLKDFTRYLDDAVPFSIPYVPVEAFAGLVQKPFYKGWRKDRYSCRTGCQDLRTTIEWIMAMSVESKQHVRARTNLAFICQEGLIAVTEEMPSLREKESEQDVEEALDSLKYRMPTRTDQMSLRGSPGPLTKCKCVEPTAAVQTPKPKQAIAPDETLPEGSRSRGKIRKQPEAGLSHEGTPTEKVVKQKRARPGRPAISGGPRSWKMRRGPGDQRVRQRLIPDADRPVESDNTQIDGGLEITDFPDIDTRPRLEPGRSMCYDFDFAQLPSVDLPPTQLTQLIDQQTSAEYDSGSVAEMIRLMVSSYASESDQQGIGTEDPSTSTNPNSSKRFPP